MRTKWITPFVAATLVLAGAVSWLRSRAADSPPLQKFEYAAIRWDGRDNTHLIRANGKVEFLGPLLSRVKRPDRVDERVFYLTVAVNAAAGEGFEIAAATPDAIFLRRTLQQ